MNAQVMGNVLSPRLSPVNICPLGGRRFSYFKRVRSWVEETWVTIFAVLVPMGYVAVINRLGALINTELVNYRIEVDGIPDPVANKIYEVDAFTGERWEYAFFWSMCNRLNETMFFIEAKMLLDPIVVQQNSIFSLMAWPWWGWAGYGIGGGVMGFYAPQEWYLRHKQTRGKNRVYEMQPREGWRRPPGAAA